MQQYDGIARRSIVILDNCSIHHVAEVTELFREAGIVVFFNLPPYSLDLNPIEELFSYVNYLKRHNELLQAITDPTPIIQAAFDNVSPD